MIPEMIVRADARPHTGHLMRCLALAEAWKALGGRSVFVSAIETPALRRRVADAGHSLEDLASGAFDVGDPVPLLERLARTPGAVVVLDGYDFDTAYQRAVKSAAGVLVVVDDFVHAEHYWADIVLNQNLNAATAVYPCEPYTKVLRGPKYALLRPEFLPYRDWERGAPEVARRALITFGGSDPGNQTCKALTALSRLDGEALEATVVVGPSNPHVEEIEKTARACSLETRVLHAVDDMASLMAWADLAVGAGGTTCQELAFMGLPAVVLVVADNQRLAVQSLADAGVVVSFGEADCVDVQGLAEAIAALAGDAARRRRMSESGRTMVDGLGAERVVRALNEALDASSRNMER